SFFFSSRRRHTRFSRDWSSDVCSSDLSVMVAIGTDKEMVSYLDQCSALITEEGGLTSHAAVVGINLGIPVIVGVENATNIIKDGQEITVDSTHGVIYNGHASVL